MARPLRFEYAGATYHVMARGDGGKRIFLEEEDAKGFFFRLAEVCERCGWKVHAYVLMSNHFHLLLETPEPNLVDGMRYLMGTFSQGWNSGNQFASKAFIAPFNDGHFEANLPQDKRQGTAAFSPAPAIHQRLPVAWLVHHMGFDVAGDVFGHQSGTYFLGFKGADLLVKGAYLDALFVIERRPAQSAGQVVFGVFALRTCIQDGVKLVQSAHGFKGRDQVKAHFSCFLRVGQTLASMRGCAASLGWMRSL